MRILENLIKNQNNNDFDKGKILAFIGEMQQDDLNCLFLNIKRLLEFKNRNTGKYGSKKEPFNILNEFFNHKSDANKYLTAEEQEDLENNFHDWLFDIFYKIEF